MRSFYYISTGMILFLFISYSCSKDSSGQIDCLAVLPPFVLDFKVVDGQGEDLFFGENPPYVIEEFKVIKKAEETEQELPVTIEEEDSKFLRVTVPPSIQDTCYLMMSADDVDTLVYFGSERLGQECPELQIDSVIFNNKKMIPPDTEIGIYYFTKINK